MILIHTHRRPLLLAVFGALFILLATRQAVNAESFDGCTCTDDEKLTFLRDAISLLIGRVMAATTKLCPDTAPGI